MDYATLYTSNTKDLYNINEVRRFKGAFLPIELVEPTGKNITDCYANVNEESALLWIDKD